MRILVSQYTIIGGLGWSLQRCRTQSDFESAAKAATALPVGDNQLFVSCPKTLYLPTLVSYYPSGSHLCYLLSWSTITVGIISYCFFVFFFPVPEYCKLAQMFISTGIFSWAIISIYNWTQPYVRHQALGQERAFGSRTAASFKIVWLPPRNLAFTILLTFHPAQSFKVSSMNEYL